MKRKKVIKWIFLSIMFIFLSYHFLKIMRYIMIPESMNMRTMSGFYTERKNSLDVICLGGSALGEYYEPLRAFEKEGIASYDYGVQGIQAESYKYLIKEALKTQSPKLIVIDARAFQYRELERRPKEADYRYVASGLKMSQNKIDFINDNIEKYLQQDPTSYYFDLMKYHRNLKNEKIDDQLKMAYGKYHNPWKGFFQLVEIWTKFENREKQQTEERVVLADESKEILLDLLEFLPTTDCEYLFVVSPYVQTEWQKKKYNYIEDIIREHGYEFVDFNDYYEEIDLDFTTDFYDQNHVNIFGSEKFTDFFAKYLKEHYELPNRRNEGAYLDWYEGIPEWKEKVEHTKEVIQKQIEEEE